MKRLKKAMLMLIRNSAYRCKCQLLVFWADEKLRSMATVHIMPELYYRLLFFFCMKAIESNRYRKSANWAIHTIPFHLRFKTA